MPDINFDHSAPILPVINLQETIAFYREKLGFSDDWIWEDSDAGCKRDKISMLFTKDPAQCLAINTPNNGLDIMWFCGGVNELCEEYKAKGVPIRSAPEDKPWGMREFTIQDNNGYFFRIASGYEVEWSNE